MTQNGKSSNACEAQFSSSISAVDVPMNFFARQTPRLAQIDQSAPSESGDLTSLDLNAKLRGSHRLSLLHEARKNPILNRRTRGARRQQFELIDCQSTLEDSKRDETNGEARNEMRRRHSHEADDTGTQSQEQSTHRIGSRTRLAMNRRRAIQRQSGQRNTTQVEKEKSAHSERLAIWTNDCRMRGIQQLSLSTRPKDWSDGVGCLTDCDWD